MVTRGISSLWNLSVDRAVFIPSDDRADRAVFIPSGDRAGFMLREGLCDVRGETCSVTRKLASIFLFLVSLCSMSILFFVKTISVVLT